MYKVNSKNKLITLYNYPLQYSKPCKPTYNNNTILFLKNHNNNIENTKNVHHVRNSKTQVQLNVISWNVSSVKLETF